MSLTGKSNTFRFISSKLISARILANVEYMLKGERVKKTKVNIGRMPMMLRSSHCILNGKNEAELAALNECPLDPGRFCLNGWRFVDECRGLFYHQRK